MKINNLMKQFNQMQSQMQNMQDQLAEEKINVSVGGGMINAVFNGKGEMMSIAIDPEEINPNDKDMLEDLIISAVNDGIEKSRKLAEDQTGKLLGGLSSMIPGLR